MTLCQSKLNSGKTINSVKKPALFDEKITNLHQPQTVVENNRPIEK